MNDVQMSYNILYIVLEALPAAFLKNTADSAYCQLSSGREVSMELVSIKIPRNTKRVVGPSSLLGARGMPTSDATWRMVLLIGDDYVIVS